MNKLLTAVCTSFIFMFPTAKAQTMDHHTCTQIAELAESVMEARQLGGDIIHILNRLETLEDTNPFKEPLIGLTHIAFETPRYSTESMQERAMNDFKSQVYIECIKH